MALHRRLFFLLIIFLPTQLGFHFWPEWAYVLGRRVDYLSPTVYLTDIFIVFIVATFLISHFKFLIKQRNFQIFLMFAALNILFAKNQPVALYKWFKVFEFVGLGWYIVKNRYRISDISRPIMIGVLYSSVIALVQFAIQRSVGGSLWFLGERTFDIETPGIARWEGFGRLLLRPYATFPHPNVLGGYLAVLLPLLSNLQIYKSTNLQIKKRVQKMAQWATVVTGLIALALSFSRSAWVAFFVGVGLINRKFIVPALLIVVFILLRVNAHEESVMVRRDLNAAAISIWKQSPLIGVGLGNFVVELPKLTLNRQGNFLQPVHNIYLLVLAETGIIGFAFFASLLFRSSWSKAFLCLLIIGLVDHYPLTLQQGQLLFTLLFAFSMIQ